VVEPGAVWREVDSSVASPEVVEAVVGSRLAVAAEVDGLVTSRADRPDEVPN
jgi:hypothetical protein